MLQLLTDSRADLARWPLAADDAARLCGVIERHRDRLDDSAGGPGCSTVTCGP
jgi:hypothetical protein